MRNIPGVLDEGQHQASDTSASKTLTTLNVVFNGTMVMGFDDTTQRVTVVAPDVVGQQHTHHHLYFINGEPFDRQDFELLAPTTGPRPKSLKDIGGAIREILTLSQSETGGMPKPSAGKGAIQLPYPDRIEPMRMVRLRFTPLGSRLDGTWAGALVFVYDNAIKASIAVKNSNCDILTLRPQQSEIYILAGLHPGSLDPGDQHSKDSWDAIAKIIGQEGWTWKCGTVLTPHDPIPGVGHPVDAPPFDLPEPARPSVDSDGGNCKVPMGIVTNP